MKTKKGDFIEIEYTAIIKEGSIVFDTTDEKTAKENKLHDKNVNYKPIVVCLGNKELVPGLDDFLVDKETDKEYEVEIRAKEAFGEKDSKLYQLVNTHKFLKQNIRPFPGLQVNIDNILGIVKSVSGGRTMVDFNHPLAGKDVIYKVKINKILEDTNEKIRSYLDKTIGKDAKFEFESKKLIIESKIPKELQKPLSEALKKAISDIEEVEFKSVKNK